MGGCAAGTPRFLFVMYGEVKQVSFVMSAPPNEGGCVVGAPQGRLYVVGPRLDLDLLLLPLFIFFLIKEKLLGGRHRKRRGFYGSEEGGGGAPPDGGSKNRVPKELVVVLGRAVLEHFSSEISEPSSHVGIIDN